MNDKQFRRALSAGLSGEEFVRQHEVLARIRGEKNMKTRHFSFALACALILTLLTAGAALAAALGLFGSLGQLPENAYDAERLRKLEDVSTQENIHSTLQAPQPSAAPAAPQTDYDQLLSRQYGRSFDLTIHQSYCDGNRLYYSYTLKTDPASFLQGVGMPTGVEAWDMEQPGKRYEEVWSNDDQQKDEAVRDWLGSHESSWIAYDSWGVGDGAELPDGSYCQILSSSTRYADSSTIEGYQEVSLPDGYMAGDSVTIELTVMYGASLYYQDQTGVYWAHIAPPENRGILRIPVTVSLSGETQPWIGAGVFDHYAVKSSLKVSDVDITGKAILKCPEEWSEAAQNLQPGTDWVEYYVLVADGEILRNLDVNISAPLPGRLELTMRFDLPQSIQTLSLRPVYHLSGEHPDEDVVLQPGNTQ